MSDEQESRCRDLHQPILIILYMPLCQVPMLINELWDYDPCLQKRKQVQSSLGTQKKKNYQYNINMNKSQNNYVK